LVLCLKLNNNKALSVASHLVAPHLTSEESIKSFAKEMGIHSGIVVGRLQHKKIIPWGCFNSLKVKYATATPHLAHKSINFGKKSSRLSTKVNALKSPKTL
jgi:hypothetical protein